MNIGLHASLGNGLNVLVDWLEFTLSNSTEPSDAMALLGYSRDEFHLLPSGKFGYRSRLISSQGVNILYDGNENMGVHVSVTGSGMSDVLSHYLNKRLVPTPFHSMAYEPDTDFSTVFSDLLRDILSCGSISRLDLSVDDHGARFFTLQELDALVRSGQCSTHFRNFTSYVNRCINTGEVLGYTLNFGSRTSECFLRVYDKQLEQNAKRKEGKEPLLTEPWVRWELELKDHRANRAARCLVDGMELGAVIVGVLANSVRFINKDNDRKSRCSNLEKWEAFISGISALRLYQPQELKTIDDSVRWIDRQVAPTLAAVLLAHDGDIRIFTELLSGGRERLNKNHRRMIQEYQYRERVKTCG